MSTRVLPSGLRMALRPVITPVYRAWWRFNRGMTLGVRGVARDAQGRVVLIRHTYQPGWHLPGGGVESGETLEQAALKEMAEEAGVHALAPPRLFAVYANHRNFPNDHVAVFVFDQWVEGAAKADGEIAEIGRFGLHELPAGVSPGARARLAELYDGAPVSAHW